MKRTLIASVLVAAFAATNSSAAHAAYSYSDAVDVTPASRTARGSLSDTHFRNAATYVPVGETSGYVPYGTNRHIGCGVITQPYSGGVWHFAFCSAEDYSGERGSCFTTNPDFARAVQSINSTSHVIFSWDAGGQCTFVQVEQSSRWYNAMLPDGERNLVVLTVVKMVRDIVRDYVL